MPLFKCKMCGGDLEIKEGMSVAECQYCGTQQTLPRLDSDRRANLYDRANHFRRNNEYDKAMSIYEQILNEDSTDAEAYWSLVLCRYGIEYVEDPATHKRVPTVNRAQFTSIFADEDYKQAIAHADGAQRAVYEAEAKAIDDIQKGILEISSKEEPFDVFICYKETDNNGRRTPDSVLANDLYHQLTQEGFKVFFSRITLEDKLGTAYEPYIFAALNSAKVMVVLGTRPEYFNAVWVKNEWSRYLALIKNGAKKVLIPAYRDMDPYDLPEEFSHLQAQDMSKLGFMQDLIRGIKKLTETDEPHSVVKETVTVNTAVANTAPLLKRAFMFLEDGDWRSADEYCEKVLDADPENAQAYLGKLMAEMRIRRQEELADCSEPFDKNGNYQKALRFADEQLAGTLNRYIAHINERNENQRLTNIYGDAISSMQAAKTEGEFKAAAGIFQTIPGFKDANELAKQCMELAETARKNTIYNNAKSTAEVETKQSLKNALELFRSLPGWQDADEQAAACERKIEELKAKEEAERIATEKRRKRNKKIGAIVASVAVVCIAFVIVLNTIIIPNGQYNDAVALMNDGKYEEAIATFEAMDNYKDSSEQIAKCRNAITEKKYQTAVSLIDTESYEESLKILSDIGNYKDAPLLTQKCKYNLAMKKIQDGNYESGYSLLNEIPDYEDATEQINKSKYARALTHIDKKEYHQAYELLKDLSYLDADKYAQYCYAQTTEDLYVKIQTLTSIQGFLDADTLLKNTRQKCAPFNGTWFGYSQGYHDVNQYVITNGYIEHSDTNFDYYQDHNGFPGKGTYHLFFSEAKNMFYKARADGVDYGKEILYLTNGKLKTVPYDSPQTSNYVLCTRK